jgi:ribose-phosphate pyrophosphokinase
MIASGESVLDLAYQLKEKGARRVFVFATFGLFTSGPEKFDKAYEEGKIDKIFTTNLNYRNPAIIARPWYAEVDMSKFVAYIIENMNKDASISTLLNPVEKIHCLLENVRNK